MASDKPATRRRYSAALKAQVMAECDAPGASVAKVAMARGINANVVHRWRQLVRDGRPARATTYAPNSHRGVSGPVAAPGLKQWAGSPPPQLSGDQSKYSWRTFELIIHAVTSPLFGYGATIHSR